MIRREGFAWELLARAIAILARPESWLHRSDHVAVTSKGNSCPSSFPGAVKWSLNGALTRAAFDTKAAYYLRDFACAEVERAEGIVDGPFGMCETSAGRTMSMKQGRRRCESKRWVERTYAEAWYREEMWRQRLVAMGFRVVTDTEVGGQNG